MTTSFPPADRDGRRAALGWAAAGLAAHLVLVAGALARAGGNPQWFIHFGPENPSYPVARKVLGDGVLAPERLGHDGQAFWLLARDPLLLDDGWDPSKDVDRPTYRAQRVAYPLLASVWRLGGERALVWGLLITNLVVVFVGGYGTGRLSQALGGPSRGGLAFALNPGVAMSTMLDVADGLSLAALVGCLLALYRGRPGWAVAAGVLAVLAKESALIPLAGVALLGPAVPRRARVLLVAAPAAAAATWGAYVRWRLAWLPADVQEFAAPFQGYLFECRHVWVPEGAWGHATVAAMTLFAAAAAAWRWWRRRTLVLAGALPVACLVPFFSPQVLDIAVNPLRVAAPLLTFLMLDVLAPGPAARRRGAEPPEPGDRTRA